MTHIQIILRDEFDCAIYFCQTTYFDSFWGTLGVSGVGGRGMQKCQKLPIPLKMTPRSWKFAQRYNFWSQILYYYSFKTNHKFWSFWGNPRGQKGSKIAHFFQSNPSEAAYLHREIISHQIFDLILQIKNLSLFGGILGVKWGSKRVKNCLSC